MASKSHNLFAWKIRRPAASSYPVRQRDLAKGCLYLQYLVSGSLSLTILLGKQVTPQETAVLLCSIGQRPPPIPLHPFWLHRQEVVRS